MRHKSSVAPKPRHRLSWILVLAVSAGLAACSKDKPADAPAAGPAAATTAAPAAVQQSEAEKAAQAAAAALAALSPEELRSRGSQALREQRLYAPAGDNAMEYYLALRERSDKPDASGESALIDLMPYAIIAAEQAIGREDFVEADRLEALIERTDPQAPALPRVREAIVKGREGVDLRAAEALARAEQQEKDREDAAKRAEEAAAAAAAAPTPAPVAATPAATPPPAAAAPTTPVAAAEEKPAPEPVAAKPTAPAPAAARTTPVAVSTPQPEFPVQALRGGITGEVVVEYTIGKDGSVTNARIVRAQPRGTFDRSVLSTVRRWQFEKLDAPVTQTRTIAFR